MSRSKRHSLLSPWLSILGPHARAALSIQILSETLCCHLGPGRMQSCGMAQTSHQSSLGEFKMQGSHVEDVQMQDSHVSKIFSA